MVMPENPYLFCDAGRCNHKLVPGVCVKDLLTKDGPDPKRSSSGTSFENLINPNTEETLTAE